MRESDGDPRASKSPTVRDYLEERGYNEWDSGSPPASGRDRIEALSVQVALVREPTTNVRPTACNKREVAAVFHPLAELDREHLAVALVGHDRRLNGVHLVSIGNRDTAPCEIANVFKTAILTNSTSVILVHNHPSGRTNPSCEDIELTKRLLKAGEIMGIPLDDHIIIGENGYQSTIDRGRMSALFEEANADEIPRARPKLWAPKPVSLPTLTEDEARRDHPTAEIWVNPHNRLGLEEETRLWVNFTKTAPKKNAIVIGGPPRWSPRLWRIVEGAEGLELSPGDSHYRGEGNRCRTGWEILATVVGLVADSSNVVPIGN